MNKIKLNNGLQIVINKMPRMQSVSLGIWVKVGGRHEDIQIKGISHFLEHMLFKGSKKYDYKQIKELIEGKGGSLNAFTADEATCYLCKVRPQNLSLSLDILSDMALNPAISAKEVEKERMVILEEIKMYKDLPQHHVSELLEELLWPNHTLGVNLAGTFESVSKISQDDLFAYQRKYYHPKNIVIAISGLFNRDEIYKRIEDIFVREQERQEGSFSPAVKPPRKPELTCLFKETEQTHLAMGLPSLRQNHPDRYALGILNIILGANMSSRLFNKVREEKGLCYSIHSQTKGLADTGAFFISAGMDNKKVTEALSVVIDELRNIKSELVTEDEFIRAKEFYIGQLAMSLDDTMENMLWFGSSMVSEHKTYSLKYILKKIESLTRQDIKRVAEKIFDLSNLKVALIGPLKEKEQESIRDLLK